MSDNKITGYDIYDFIINGAKRIISNEHILNDINVFPVADSDTGSNLSYTMKCIIAKSYRHEHLGQTLGSISQVASEDSFGNSGTIFASYLNGLAEETRHKKALTPKEFAIATGVATEYAYRSVSSPEEGTMLTVMQDWSNYLLNNSTDSKDIKDILKDAFGHAQESLMNTKNQLSILKEADVVDAGALGFIYFLEGILEFLDTTATHLIHKTISALPKIHKNTGQLTYRYCSEFLVENLNETFEKHFKKNFDDKLDSLVIQKNNDFTKIHCHADMPKEISEYLSSRGTLIKAKIDDMVIQNNITEKSKLRIGVITDTIADLPDEWIENYQVLRIPLQLIVDGNTYVDRYTVDGENLHEMIQKASVHPSSGQPGEYFIEKSLKFMLEHFDFVIGIFVSSKMSGLYDKVKLSADKINSSRLHIFDSKTNSACQGLILHDTIRMIESGLSPTEILSTLDKTLDKYHIHVEIPDLYYATKSGRVPKILGSIANMFNLKVIISINKDGKGIVCRERSMKQILQRIEKSHEIENYVIVHSDNLQDAKAYAKAMEDITGKSPVFINEVSSVVAAFVGQGSVGIGYKVK
ncbi:DegV family protein [Fusibacter sp. JL216-2]|uniref:DegV family protein n=1 Tax=Fusibacter sp. JL216-2 TaxID=3071453 RepID=UPI003D32ACF7